MTLSEGPQGQDELGRDPQRGEDEEWTAILKESTFMIFQAALARRRAEDTMRENDLAMATSWREMTFIHSVLSDVYTLLRRLTKYGAANGFTWNDKERAAADRLGQASELGSSDSPRG